MISLSVASRNAILAAVRDQVDSGSSAGKLRVYTGPRPANGAAITSQILLSEHDFADPCAGTPANGELVFSTILSDVAPGTGVAVWARVVNSAGAHVMDVDVGSLTSAADIKVNNVNVEAGATVNVLSAKLKCPVQG